ncbi:MULTISPECIES: phage tail tube protein [unclassified Sphingobium]|uniref:phage tail tube protein n=1 Tax=unclassified Sphingobium TaxID=2611147 RepID=UPI0035A5F8EE
MANKNQVIGRAKIRVDGQLMETAGDTTLDIGGVTREPVPGDYEAGAFRESSVRPSKLEISVLAKGSFSASAWAAMVDATISVEFDNGRTYVMRSAYSEGAPPLTTSDGKAKAVAYAKPAEEVR